VGTAGLIATTKERHMTATLRPPIAALDSQLAPPYSPETLWSLALGELKPQMSRATFDAWLLGSRVIPVASGPTFLVVAVRNQYACEWLAYRLQPVIERALAGLAGYPVRVCFVTQAIRTIRSDDGPTGPSAARICLDYAAIENSSVSKK
jgi:chromosomal replication initiation ATPase DnaA